LVLEEGTNFSIDGNGSLATLDQLAEAMNYPWRKTFSTQHLCKKIPINSVVGFLKVEFK
jgi:hypothetical protein